MYRSFNNSNGSGQRSKQMEKACRNLIVSIRWRKREEEEKKKNRSEKWINAVTPYLYSVHRTQHSLVVVLSVTSLCTRTHDWHILAHQNLPKHAVFKIKDWKNFLREKLWKQDWGESGIDHACEILTTGQVCLGKVHRWKIIQQIHSVTTQCLSCVRNTEFESNFIAKAQVISVACMETRAVLMPSEHTKIVFGRGSAPDPAGGAHDAPRIL